MAAIDPDELPKKKIVHELGQDLSLLSEFELSARIMEMKSRITWLSSIFPF